MALVVTTPQTGDPFGPGFTVRVVTDRVGPEPPGTAWVIDLSAPPGEELVASRSSVYTGNSFQGRMYHGSDTVVVPSFVEPINVSGESAQLRIRLMQPGPTFVEDETVTVVLDRQTGVVQELADWFYANRQTLNPGLSSAEHDAVLQTNVGVIAMAGLNPLDLVGDLVQAIGSNNPMGYGSLSDPYTISGDGELPLGGIPNSIWGVYWIATAIPAGLGHFHGQSEEWRPRLVQWRTTHFLDGIEMVSAVEDFQTHGQLWKFPVQTPQRLEYSVLPGVILQARWWQFP